MSVNVLQFGEGNFLRGFFDWALNNLKANGRFDGKCAVVSPIDESAVIDLLKAQNGRYTVNIAGIDATAGEVNRFDDVQVISNAWNIYRDWARVLDFVAQSDTKVLVSNTTEAGIVFADEDFSVDDYTDEVNVPKTFPAKLTVLLYHRFAKGLSPVVLVPCELIEAGGEKLRECILKHIDAWQLPSEFANWINDGCTFYNTLVDRIVPGYPKDEVEAIRQQIGWEDNLIVKAEPFGFFGLELSAKDGARPDISLSNPLEELIPLSASGLDVLYTNGLLPYRERKVYLLNAIHTAMSMLGASQGLETVREVTENAALNGRLLELAQKEIAPMLDLPQAELQEFSSAVWQRFQNPYIQHELSSIALNEQAKYEVRVLPIIQRYEAESKPVPENLAALQEIAREKWGI